MDFRPNRGEEGKEWNQHEQERKPRGAQGPTCSRSTTQDMGAEDQGDRKGGHQPLEGAAQCQKRETHPQCAA